MNGPLDLVSRKWITEVVSSEATSTQVELGFTAALEAEGHLDTVEARPDDGLVDPTVDEAARPILLTVSDNGPQMTSGSTREFIALRAIAQHFGRPGTPTDQALGGELQRSPQGENPNLAAIEDPATLRAELAIVREHYNTVRRHEGIGYVIPRRRTPRPRRRDPRRPTRGPGAGSSTTPCPPPTSPQE